VNGPLAAKASADRNNLDKRVLVLNQKYAKIDRQPASTRIVIPMPDDIWAANRIRGSLAAVLNGTPGAVIRDQADAEGYIPLAESLVLSYNNSPGFTLTDGGSFNLGSGVSGGLNVMALFAWPVSLDQNNCNSAVVDHPLMNALIDLPDGSSPTIKSLNVPTKPAANLDDQAFGVDASFLRPLCVAPDSSTSNAKPKVAPGDRGTVHIFTASHTGCALEVFIE
jgi:hypothetical protein